MTSTLIAAEIQFQESANAIELLVKDEEMRKIKLSKLLLEDDIDRLNDQVFDEAERGDAAEAQVEKWRADAEDTEDRLERTLNELRVRTRELETLKAELLTLHDTSADSTKLLTEKLALSREISTLKPELEHLRSQASTNEGLLADKLSLQGQLDAAQAELQNEKRNLKRALSKQGATSQQDAEREEEITQLQAELMKEKRERQKAVKAMARAHDDESDALKKELAEEKSARQRAERSADIAADAQVKDLRKELAKEKKEKQKLEEESRADKAQIEQLTKSSEAVQELKMNSQDEGKEAEKLKKELSKLRAEHEKDTKAAAKAASGQVEELQRELAREKDEREALNEKLTLFREKLRATKEKLKQSEAELLKAQETAQAASPHVAASKTLKNPRKRPAVRFDPDAAIGTPGDAGPAKRSKRASSVVVEKSTFSITPFLNRTTSIAPDSPPKDADAHDQDQPIASIEATSPTAAKSKTKKSGATALAPTSTNKIIAKSTSQAGNRKKTAIAPSIMLNTVTEEDPDEDNAAEDQEATTTSGQQQQKRVTSQPSLKAKPVLKARKSLASFASFRDGSLPPQPLVVQNKKKRKLLGNTFGAKTIFDEDEEDGASQPMVGARVVSAGGQRAFGAIGGGGFGKLVGGWGAAGGKIGGKAKGPLMVTGDGFMFSPLKKDRRAMAAANGA